MPPPESYPSSRLTFAHTSSLLSFISTLVLLEKKKECLENEPWSQAAWGHTPGVPFTDSGLALAHVLTGTVRIAVSVSRGCLSTSRSHDVCKTLIGSSGL